jgi:hypothetical protein
MVDTPRGPRLLDVAFPLLVAASWVFQGWLALDSEHKVSGKAVLVWVSFVAAGVCLGVALATMGLRRAVRLGRTPGILRRESAQPMFFLMFGLLQVSYGVGSVSEGAMSAGDWGFLLFTSLGGGAFAGVALVSHQARLDRSSTPQETSRAGS